MLKKVIAETNSSPIDTPSGVEYSRLSKAYTVLNAAYHKKHNLSYDQKNDPDLIRIEQQTTNLSERLFILQGLYEILLPIVKSPEVDSMLQNKQVADTMINHKIVIPSLEKVLQEVGGEADRFCIERDKFEHKCNLLKNFLVTLMHNVFQHQIGNAIMQISLYKTVSDLKLTEYWKSLPGIVKAALLEYRFLSIRIKADDRLFEILNISSDKTKERIKEKLRNIIDADGNFKYSTLISLLIDKTDASRILPFKNKADVARVKKYLLNEINKASNRFLLGSNIDNLSPEALLDKLKDAVNQMVQSRDEDLIDELPKLHNKLQNFLIYVLVTYHKRIDEINKEVLPEVSKDLEPKLIKVYKTVFETLGRIHYLKNINIKSLFKNLLEYINDKLINNNIKLIYTNNLPPEAIINVNEELFHKAIDAIIENSIAAYNSDMDKDRVIQIKPSIISDENNIPYLKIEVEDKAGGLKLISKKDVYDPGKGDPKKVQLGLSYTKLVIEVVNDGKIFCEDVLDSEKKVIGLRQVILLPLNS